MSIPERVRADLVAKGILPAEKPRYVDRPKGAQPSRLGLRKCRDCERLIRVEGEWKCELIRGKQAKSPEDEGCSKPHFRPRSEGGTNEG